MDLAMGSKKIVVRHGLTRTKRLQSCAKVLHRASRELNIAPNDAPVIFQFDIGDCSFIPEASLVGAIALAPTTESDSLLFV
jgi:hypothetical protein